MHAKRSRILIALRAFLLVGAGVGISSGARSDNAECQHDCNGLYASCNDECSSSDAVCLAGCAAVPDPGECRTACRSANKACKNTCSGIKSECKNACPRGNQSTIDPLP